MDNPNEYDDGAFTKVSLQMQEELPSLLDELWDAGASIQNVEQEIASALENTELASGHSFRVKVTVE